MNPALVLVEMRKRDAELIGKTLLSSLTQLPHLLETTAKGLAERGIHDGGKIYILVLKKDLPRNPHNGYSTIRKTRFQPS